MHLKLVQKTTECINKNVKKIPQIIQPQKLTKTVIHNQ